MKPRIGVVQRISRLSLRKLPKQIGSKMRAANLVVPVERKENLVCHSALSQPSCSKSTSKLARPIKSKSRKDLSLKNKNLSPNKLKGRGPIVNESNLASVEPGQSDSTKQKNEEHLRLREICFIKNTEGNKTIIAKYKNNKESEEFDDSLVVSWDAPTSKATVFTQKTRVTSAPRFVQNKSPSEPGTSKQGTFRIHNFTKNHPLGKSKLLKKQTLRRLASATELGKIDRKKKKKLRIK